ncbi:PC-esterase domain-containing protein 1A-like [Uloborus diversus]|uniref:PC-esterase domain-containing protein 1A-like n=1 Tax=Uloborus diversus TaxID=327109 RepID=UPI002409E8A5|nr:PC-esterase domain-containing protein 1A-like [Uloborus diversus]
MCDIFLKEDVRQLFRGKHVVFMGDSNIRALYKDMVCLSENSKFITLTNLKSKLPSSVYGDKLVFSGPLCNGRNYREERDKRLSGNTNFSYFFLTRVFDDYVETVLKHITSSQDKPDVVVLNSCVWDISRWGPNGIKMYKENLVKLMKQFQKLLPKNCLVIWVTTPPIASEMKGGFLVKELQFLKYSLRFHVVESNYYARKIVVSHGYDVLDFHYHLRMQLHRRDTDGVHWFPEAVRYLLNLLLTHISLAWGKPLPHR